MYLSRVTLTPADPRALLSLIGGRMRADDPSFAHKMIWTLFAGDQEADRDFQFEVVQRRPLQALVRSARPPRDGLGCWTVETIPFDPPIEAGCRFRFSLNTVAARTIPVPGAKRGRPTDVVMAEWRALPAARREQIAPDDIAEPVAREWLAAQSGKHGFEVEDAALLGYDRHRFLNKGRAAITFGSLRLTGHLRVIDPAAFGAVLSTGLGRARGFGFGMLQIAAAPVAPAPGPSRDEPLVVEDA